MSGLFRNGHECAGMHANAAAARQDVGHNTREVAEMLHAFIGLGNSVILTASGHRIELRSTQHMTIDPYLLVGMILMHSGTFMRFTGQKN